MLMENICITLANTLKLITWWLINEDIDEPIKGPAIFTIFEKLKSRRSHQILETDEREKLETEIRW